MTLAEIIARHEQATVTPIRRPTVALTARGHADVAIRRAVAAIRACEPQDRAEVLAEFAASLRGIIRELAGPEGNHAS